MTLRELLAKREAIRTELRSILDASTDGNLTDEQRGRADTLQAEAAGLNVHETRVAALEDLDRRATGTPIGGSDPRLDSAMTGFSVVRAMASAAGLAVDAGRERELSAEVARRSGRQFQGIAIPMAALAGPVEQRTITTALPAGGPGGNLIATNLLAEQFIDRLRAALVVRQLGARILSGLTGNVAIPRLKGSATAGWVAENTALTATDQQVDQVTLSPKTAGAITEFSRTVLLQASPDIEQIVRSDLAAVLAQALDLAAISGTGASNMPRGILSTVGIGNVALGANGLALTYDNVVDLMGTCQDANAESGNALLSNYKVQRQARKLKDTTGKPLGEEVVFQGARRAFTTNVPANLTKGTSTGICSAMIYGNFADLLIGIWGDAVDILVNPYESTAYSKGNVQVRAMMTCDIAVRHAESFSSIQDILA